MHVVTVFYIYYIALQVVEGYEVVKAIEGCALLSMLCIMLTHSFCKHGGNTCRPFAIEMACTTHGEHRTALREED
jgi:succinate dehydrogenase/fumarate reductase cytochrome b subunit